LKRDIARNYILEILLIVILSLALFVSNIVNKKILALILIIYAVSTSFIKTRRGKSTYEKQVIIMMLFFSIIYVIMYYLLGFYFGYYEAPAKFSLYTIWNFIIPIFLIILSSEIIRNTFIKQNGKYNFILLFIIMVLIDLILYIGVYNLSNLEDFLAVIGFVFFSSVACNLLYNYIAKRYGTKGIIIYRSITILYVYFIPIVPNIYIFFQSFIRMVYPYIIYMVLDNTYSKTDYATKYKDRKRNYILTFITLVLMAILIGLISCDFKYGLIVVGSGSMTGTIDKGDVVLYEAYSGKEALEEDMIIIFNHNNIKTIHRIIEIENVNGEVRVYTKGDANNKMDDEYTLEKDIIGIVKLKIKYIGYPTIWVKDIFNNN